MKVDFYVMGVYRGQREVGENSLVGKLANGLYGEAMVKAQEMQADIDELFAGDATTKEAPDAAE